MLCFILNTLEHMLVLTLTFCLGAILFVQLLFVLQSAFSTF